MHGARRAAAALAAVLIGLVLDAATALGAAGGGSGGFGGGGGGGGGFGGGGGGFGGGGGTGTGVGVGWQGTLVIIAGVAGVMVFSAVKQKRDRTFSRAWAAARDRATAKRRAARTARVEGTALVAAEDDPAFAAERVRAEAEALFRAIQEAWDRDDRDALAAMVGPDLMTEWGLRLADFASKGWRNRVSVRECGVEYVGLVNRPEESEDRVVVRISALLEDYVIDADGDRFYHDGNTGGETALREYWTLGKREGRWTLLSIEQDEEGEHQLDEPMEADPLEDSRLTDQARVEAAVADAAPGGVPASELDDEDARTAEAKARDLAVVDARFDPDIIESTVRRGVAAWAEAVDGGDAAFSHLARPELLQDLLYPPGGGRSLRVVLRAPKVRDVTLLGLDSDATPPTATVRIRIEGVRYLEDRNTLDVVGGDKDRAARFDGIWTLSLDGPDDAPWRISAVDENDPRVRRPPSAP